MTSEQTDDVLKGKIKKWWTDHPQGYGKNGEFDRNNVYTCLSDHELLSVLSETDKNMRSNAYYAQNDTDIIFSKLMQNEKIKGKKVLEIGCGLGAHSESLYRLGGKVTSIDLNPTSVIITGRRAKLKGLDIDVREMDAENLSFDNNTFDYVWSWGVLHHSPNIVKCFQEVHRVLKPGGCFSVMLYNKNSIYNWIEVILRGGLLSGGLFKGDNLQDLRNKYTDGREFGGCPLAKYYSREDIQELLLSRFYIKFQRCYGQKRSISGYFPKRIRNIMENHVSDWAWELMLSRSGFLLFTEADKR